MRSVSKIDTNVGEQILISMLIVFNKVSEENQRFVFFPLILTPKYILYIYFESVLFQVAGELYEDMWIFQQDNSPILWEHFKLEFIKMVVILKPVNN